MSKIKLTDWFEMDEHEYMMYILKGYEIVAEDLYRVAWYRNGKRHREDGPAIVFRSGTIQWYYRNGKRHREDGPAIIFADGYQSWYLNGKRHREDGPAIIEASGRPRWFLNNTEYSEDGFNDQMKKTCQKSN